MAEQNGVTNEEIVEAMQVARYMKQATVNDTIANSLKILEGKYNMISVKVLGPGCSKCKTLEAKVRDIVAKNNITAEVSKVEDINEMMNYGIMMTPGLVINEQVKSFGIIPKDDQILNWLKEN